MRILKWLVFASVFLTSCLWLSSCNQHSETDARLNLPGQVSTPSTAPSLATNFAASRLLSQASFGATRSSMESVQRLGMPAWIESQMRLPPTQIDWTPIAFYIDVNRERDNTFYGSFADIEITRALFQGPDQLRLRTTWALSNFIVISQAKIFPTGVSEYFNKLQQFALGNFADLIYMIIRDPAMAWYLDNDINRAPSRYCLDCYLNENFARELLQLFTVGVYKLHLDGSIVRDAKGNPIETYTQADVQNMARALSGWTQDNKHVLRSKEPGAGPPSNSNGFDRWMIDPYRSLHDTESKLILGTLIPAGQSADQDARAVAELLTKHPNTAPFVSQRLIQFMVKSDPSPDYVKRIAQIFVNDGTGRSGNLAAVVSALLLDPEARLHDNPTLSAKDAGRIKEPLLRAVNIMRHLECKAMLLTEWNTRKHPFGVNEQRPLAAPSVFSFYSPSHRAPGTNVKAPEQKLLTSRQFSNYFGDLRGFFWAGGSNSDRLFREAGCEVESLTKALAISPLAFIAEVNQRFFAGAMPASLRHMAEDLLSADGPQTEPIQRVVNVLSVVLTSPSYAVQR